MPSMMTGVVGCLAVIVAAAPAQAASCDINIQPDNPDSIYTVHGDGTITDHRTGLMWTQCLEGQILSGGNCSGAPLKMSWRDALIAAEASTWAGHGNWRLPNIRELQSLVETCRSNPAINISVFKGAAPDRVWSGSPAANNSEHAWGVGFDRGTVSTLIREANDISVRFVRG